MRRERGTYREEGLIESEWKRLDHFKSAGKEPVEVACKEGSGRRLQSRRQLVRTCLFIAINKKQNKMAALQINV